MKSARRFGWTYTPPPTNHAPKTWHTSRAEQRSCFILRRVWAYFFPRAALWEREARGLGEAATLRNAPLRNAVQELEKRIHDVEQHARVARDTLQDVSHVPTHRMRP